MLPGSLSPQIVAEEAGSGADAMLIQKGEGRFVWAAAPALILTNTWSQSRVPKGKRRPDNTEHLSSATSFMPSSHALATLFRQKTSRADGPGPGGGWEPVSGSQNVQFALMVGIN